MWRAVAAEGIQGIPTIAQAPARPYILHLAAADKIFALSNTKGVVLAGLFEALARP